MPCSFIGIPMCTLTFIMEYGGEKIICKWTFLSCTHFHFVYNEFRSQCFFCRALFLDKMKLGESFRRIREPSYSALCQIRVTQCNLVAGFITVSILVRPCTLALIEKWQIYAYYIISIILGICKQQDGAMISMLLRGKRWHHRRGPSDDDGKCDSEPQHSRTLQHTNDIIVDNDDIERAAMRDLNDIIIHHSFYFTVWLCYLCSAACFRFLDIVRISVWCVGRMLDMDIIFIYYK